MLFLKCRVKDSQVIQVYKKTLINLVLEFHQYVDGESLDEVEVREGSQPGLLLELTCPYQPLTSEIGIVSLEGEEFVLDSRRHAELTIRHPDAEVVRKTTVKGKNVFFQKRFLHDLKTYEGLKFTSLEIGSYVEKSVPVPDRTDRATTKTIQQYSTDIHDQIQSITV